MYERYFFTDGDERGQDRDRQMRRETGRWADSQADGQRDRQMGRKTDTVDMHLPRKTSKESTSNR